MSEYAATQNPLYEKLYRRFSCSGKTVGEIMLARASVGSGGSTETVSPSDITSEMRITRANFLPEADGTARVAARPARPFFALCRINPSAAIALLLSLLILAYLLFAGIRNQGDAPGNLRTVAAAEAHEAETVITPYV